MTKHILILLLFFITLFASQQAHAQLNDPLNRGAERWDKLVKNVNSKLEWESYFQKKYANMSADEKSKIEEWKQLILTQNTGAGGNSGNSTALTDDDNDWTAADAQLKQATLDYNKSKALEKDKYFDEMLKGLLVEPAELSDLKSNINENFVIIDMLYAEEFEKYGEKYKSYREAYPTGKYDKMKWIEEQDKRLVAIKKQYVSRLKEQSYQAGKN